MSHLDILLPFGLPPKEIAADLFRELEVPALATLVTRSGAARHEVIDAYSRSLPHEIWLARQFGLESLRSGGSPPVATAAMRELGLNSTDGTWFIVNPIHIHVALDHLVLTDPRQLALTEQEARVLFEVAQPLFDEAGKVLLYGNASTWFARADDWAQLQTSTPDAAAGHNIDVWMAKGDGERAWRKLQNEVQMHWFSHSVNTERAARGMRPINSIWLWGDSPANTQAEANRYTHAFNLEGWMSAFGQFAGSNARIAAAADLITAAPERGLLLLDALLAPALANDWSQWLAQLQALERDWFTPLLASLKSGRFDQLSLTATHATRISTFVVRRPSLRKFWIKPSLAMLS